MDHHNGTRGQKIVTLKKFKIIIDHYNGRLALHNGKIHCYNGRLALHSGKIQVVVLQRQWTTITRPLQWSITVEVIFSALKAFNA